MEGMISQLRAMSRDDWKAVAVGAAILYGFLLVGAML